VKLSFQLLSFFKINDPYRLVAVLLFTGLLSIPLFVSPDEITLQQLKSFVLSEAIADGKTMYAQVFDQTPILYAWIIGMMDFVFGRSVIAYKIVSLFIIFFQASYFSVVLIRNKVYSENNYLPALIFVVISFFSFDLTWVSPELLGAGFLLLAINNLFKEVEFKNQRDETILNMGLWIGLASLIIFSYLIFLIGTILILIVFTRLTLRRVFLLLFGFSLPHIVLTISYYFFGQLPLLISNFYTPNLAFHSESILNIGAILKLASLVIVYLLFSWFMLNREARFTKYQSQILQVMFLWLILASVEILFTKERTPHSFITLLPPLAYFVSHYLLLIRRRWISEFMLWLFIIGVPLTSLLARKGFVSGVDYSTLAIKESAYTKQLNNKRILVLSEDISVFKNNRMASYFLDWNLSKDIFDNPDYFENVIWVSDSFENDLPEIIIDPDDKMKKFFDRLPKYKNRYKREGSIYKLISS
jgi:hypothetical protein